MWELFSTILAAEAIRISFLELLHHKQEGMKASYVAKVYYLCV